MKLRSYQEEAATFLYENDRAMMLAWVGAGKTATALTALRDLFRDGHVKRVLVVAPLRVAKHVWPHEARIWAPALKLSLALGSPARRAAALQADSDVVVTNYENLAWLVKQGVQFDGVIYDELTRLKTPGTQVSKAAAKLDVPMRWGLTGSFTSNGLGDVFGQCKVIDTRFLGRSKGAFLQQYFVDVGHGYPDWQPRRNAMAAIMQRIKPMTYVLEAVDYKDSLPPCHVVPMLVDMDMVDYEKMKKEFILSFPDADAVALNAAVVTSKLQQLASGFIYTDAGTQRTSDHKFNLLDEIWEENHRANTIVVYQYQAELEELKQRYPQARGVEAIDDWNAGKVPMLLLHPKSAGHGLNLQHGGHHMVFFSLPWSMELFEQTVGRLHRSGQTRDVWVYLLQTRNTVDERIWTSLQAKQSVATMAMEALK